MEVVLSIVGSLVGKAVEYTVEPTARQLGYLFKHKAKFLNLRSKVQDLKDAKERVQQSVDAANRDGGVIFDDVQRWLMAANEKISEEAARQLQEDEEKAMKKCFAGFCPDFKSRFQLSKKADKEAIAIAKLLEQKFDSVSHPFVPRAIDIIRPVEEYEAFDSRSQALNDVMAALKDDDVNIIGVHGMGGVGKTTLVKVVARQAEEKLSFAEVVFVRVAQTPDIKRLQNEITSQLGLKINDESSDDVRAARLCDRLKKANKFLIVLDDIWKELEVNTLGIPSVDQHKGCKVLMTSRMSNVLKSMGSQKLVPIDKLNGDEAWNLFKKMGGHIAERFEFQSKAKEITQKCAGLPLAITTVAKALKHKENLYEWEDALELLKPSEISINGISDDVYSAIKMSYTYLETEGLKSIFLLCGIMGHDAVIQDLVKYCGGLGLFQRLDTVEKVRNRVLTLINKLKDSSLLLAGSSPKRFGIHDVVRDVAISIASRDRCWHVLGKGDKFEEWSNDQDTMRNCNLLNMFSANVRSNLPDVLECPNLSVFSLYGRVYIPSDFFNGIQRLKVLEFGRRMKFFAFPSSIASLKSLHTLRLVDCHLKEICILGELTSLEILDLRGSGFRVLPEEIGQLIRLKLLSLTHCYKLAVISPNVLSKLSSLEELYLYYSFTEWAIKGIENPRSNASLVELQHLSRLTTLKVHIPDVEAIPEDYLFSEKLERFKISIGDEVLNRAKHQWMKTSRMLKIKMNKGNFLVNGIKMLSRNTESLCLDGLEDDGKMFYDLNPKSFERLRFIEVQNCSMLENLFAFSIAKRLHQLEQVVVLNCMNIKGLFLPVENEEIGENDIIELNKMGILKLHYLSRFNGLWYSENISQSALFDKKVSCPALEELDLDSVSGIEEIWHVDDQLPLMSFGVQSLTSVKIMRCHKLKYVFTSSMVRSFVQLKKLDVLDCDEMQEVIQGMLVAEEGISSSSSILSVFPKLDSMELKCLPKLKRFCCGLNPIEFRSLRSLYISACCNLETFIFDNGKSRVLQFLEKVILPGLEELKIEDMKSLERLWPGGLDEHSFSKLTSIVLLKCPKLLQFFPLSVLTRLQKLDRLKICNCESIEEIIFESESKSQEGCSSSMPSLSPYFQCLTSLSLWRLPNLKSVHHKMYNIAWPSLKEMKVSDCDKVEILFGFGSGSGETSGTIQPLFWLNQSMFLNLQTLRVWSCKNMKEILHGGDDEAEIIFPHLHYLELENLPKLESFCSAEKYTFKFPSLETVFQDKCPAMKIFSQRDPKTPVLHKVQFHKRGPGYWEGSLNDTIKQLPIVREKYVMIGEEYEYDENSEEDDENSEGY